MTLFTFTREKPGDADVVQSIRVLNRMLGEKYAGCSAHVVSSSEDGNRVTVSLQIGPEIESTACMDWFTEQLARESITLVNDRHLRRVLDKVRT